MASKTEKLRKLIKESISLSDNMKEQLLSGMKTYSKSEKDELLQILINEKVKSEDIDCSLNENMKGLHKKYRTIVNEFQHSSLPKAMKTYSKKLKIQDEEDSKEILKKIDNL